MAAGDTTAGAVLQLLDSSRGMLVVKMHCNHIVRVVYIIVNDALVAHV